MDDRALVAALVAEDPRGLEGAYRGYADRLYAYCDGLLRDPAGALEAVHDTFVLASQRAGQLREPDRLRPWLYAIARNECLRRGRAAPAPPEGTETQDLLTAAVDALNPGDREVFELVVRHGLPAQDVGDVLGISVGPAQSRLARARARLAEALGQPEPSALFAAYAAAPFPTVPTELRPRLELKCFDPGLELEREAILQRAGRFDPATGFPLPRDVRRRRRLVAAGVAAVAVAALGAAAAGAAIPPLRTAAEPPRALPATATSSPSASPSPVTATATPSPPASSSPSTEPPSPPPSTSPPPPGRTAPGPSLTLDASAESECLFGGVFGYELVASATASALLDAAELFLRVGPGAVESYPMEVDGQAAAGRSEVQFDPREAQWWVEVTTEDDQRAETEPAAFTPDC
jgi:RNA polymerase sigma factor (sigma-70 family)